jgi:hypothetical protein
MWSHKNLDSVDCVWKTSRENGSAADRARRTIDKAKEAEARATRERAARLRYQGSTKLHLQLLKQYREGWARAMGETSTTASASESTTTTAATAAPATISATAAPAPTPAPATDLDSETEPDPEPQEPEPILTLALGDDESGDDAS